MSATETLARFVTETSYASLPGEAVAAAKVAILDGVANLLAGSTQPLARIVAEYVRQMGGRPDCTVVGWDEKTNPPFAAFANGVFLHCLDFEIQGYPPSHGTSSILPPALALGEQIGASGQAIITAYVIGWEVQSRLRAAGSQNLRGFHPPGIFGPLAAAAAGASMLGLTTDQTRSALGIAASRTGGLTANTGTMVKSTHPGNAGRMGVEAALLARLGFQSNPSILEASEGYVDVLFANEMDWELLTKDLGAHFHLVEPGFNIKRYPAQIHTQWAIEAVATLRKRHALRLEEIDYLELEVPRVREVLNRPQSGSGLDGTFSFEYCAAVALTEANVDIDAFSDSTRASPRVQEALSKVRLKANADVPRDIAHTWSAARVRLTDGREFSERCQGYRGSTANPMSREERLSKVRSCAQRVLAPPEIERTIAMLEALEELEDVRRLMAILARRPA